MQHNAGFLHDDRLRFVGGFNLHATKERGITAPHQNRKAWRFECGGIYQRKLCLNLQCLTGSNLVNTPSHGAFESLPRPSRPRQATAFSVHIGRNGQYNDNVVQIKIQVRVGANFKADPCVTVGDTDFGFNQLTRREVDCVMIVSLYVYEATRIPTAQRMKIKEKT